MYFHASRTSRFIEMGRKTQSGTERSRSGNGANLGFEEKLWAAADKMRGHMDAGEYKHVALGLIFLKYISDAFQERYDAIKKEPHADPEDRDEYMGHNVFWVPPEARWGKLQAAAKSPEIGKVIDNAMDAIEKENRTLKGVLPKDFARPALDKTRLGELIAYRHDRAGRPGRCWTVRPQESPFSGHPRPGLHVLPGPVRCCGGQGRGRSLHARVDRQAARRDDRAVQGPGRRLVLRVGRDVRAVREVRGGSWRPAQRPLGLRPGVEPDDLAALPDEPGDPGHRGQPWAAPRRQLSQRPAQGREGRLHPGQSTVQRLRLGRGSAPRGPTVEVWCPAGGQRQLRLGPTPDPPPGPQRRGRCRAGQRLDVVEPVGRGRDSPGDRRGRPGRLHDRHAGSVVLQHGHSCLPLVLRPK